MNSRHRKVLAALSWLAIVAVGSTLVWTVIAHAGRGVGNPAGGTSTASAEAGPSGVGEAAATAVPGSPDGQSPSSPMSTGPAGTGDGTSASTGPDPDEGGSGDGPGVEPSSGPGGPTTGPPSTNPPSTDDPDDEGTAASGPSAPVAQQKTWQGAAGRVVASCTGSKISLVSAVPNNGWHVEVDNDGPEDLEVHFELREGEDDDRAAARSLSEETQIHARCQGGTPSFTVEG